MRPEEFSQMLRNHPGSLESRSASSAASAADAAKDRLRRAFEQHSQETQERRQRLEQARAGEARRIWEQAGQEIAGNEEGVTENG